MSRRLSPRCRPTASRPAPCRTRVGACAHTWCRPGQGPACRGRALAGRARPCRVRDGGKLRGPTEHRRQSFGAAVGGGLRAHVGGGADRLTRASKTRPGTSGLSRIRRVPVCTVCCAALGIYPYLLPARDPALGMIAHDHAAGAHGLAVGLAWWIPGMLMVGVYSYLIVYRRLPAKFSVHDDGTH